MEIQGMIIDVFETVSGVSKNGKEWSIQKFILNTDETHPKKILMQRINKEHIQKYPITKNEHVKAYFDIEAKEFNGKWFNNIVAWRVERI